VRDAVNEALRRLGVPHRNEVREWQDRVNPVRSLTELVLVDRQGREAGLADVGSGVSQAVPLVCEALANRQAVPTVEQPEIHPHPALQAELGDVFIATALGEAKKALLIETHSEHRVLRIMRRIRETHLGKLPKETNLPAVRPEQVAVLCVEPDGRRSIVREFSLNERESMAAGSLRSKWVRHLEETRLYETDSVR
jgi:predicted ATPase